jgi:hypothetical protein
MHPPPPRKVVLPPESIGEVHDEAGFDALEGGGDEEGAEVGCGVGLVGLGEGEEEGVGGGGGGHLGRLGVWADLLCFGTDSGEERGRDAIGRVLGVVWRLSEYDLSCRPREREKQIGLGRLSQHQPRRRGRFRRSCFSRQMRVRRKAKMAVREQKGRDGATVRARRRAAASG